MNRNSFGLAALAFRLSGVMVAEAEITGSVTMPHGFELASTMGGAAQYPVAARSTRSSGEVQITLNERPPWVDEICGDARLTSTPASAAATITDSGTLAAALAITLTEADRAFAGIYEITATSVTQVRVRGISSAGASSEEDVTLAGTAVTELTIGIGIAKVAAVDLTVGQSLVVEITAPHGGQHVLALPQIRKNKEYELLAFSAAGGPQDAIWKLAIPRLQIAGASWKLEDNVQNQESVEISAMLLAPLDGSAAVTRTIIEPAAT